MARYLGNKALALLQVADVATDDTLYVERFTKASQEWSEKAVLAKFKELTERGYTSKQAGRYESFELTDKGRSAMLEHLGEPASAPCVLPHEDLVVIAKHAGQWYPEECCGFILSRGQEREVVPVTNVQTDLHRINPKLFRKDGRTGYAMAADEVQKVSQRCLEDGWGVAVLYHSHVDTPPIFSKDDLARAAVKDRPLFPGTDYVILGISKEETPGRPVNYAAAYRWSTAAKDFLPVRLEIERLVTV